VSCVVFLTGCNFTCPYCHNPELARGQFPERIKLNALLAFLEQRRRFLDGVVISGGEPTLWNGLAALCRAVRGLGLPVKLDTNGSRPDTVKALIRDGLVDYIAMDLKTDPELYGPPLCAEKTGPAILKSIAAIMSSDVDYEFRTTCVQPFVTEAKIRRMAMAVRGARRFILQGFNSSKTLDSAYLHSSPSGPPMEQMQSLRQLADPFVESCSIR
jgi:pyruvate formate lyase activating enzyme